MLDNIKNCIINSPHRAKVLYWTKLITITGSAQVIVQAVGFICGILVVRLLPVEEYALYTLANTMLGTMTILSDGGISTGVMAQGGKVWQNKEKLGAVLATGLELRRKFAVFSLLVSIPILCYLLQSHGASWVMTVLIAASLVPAFFAALSDSLLQVPPKLNQAILPLQRNQIEVGIGRLVLTAITLFAFPWAFVAVIASGIPRIYGNIKLRKIAYLFVDKNQYSDSEEKETILRVVKRMMPSAIYFAFSGQITIWLISVFGNTSSIAELGALTRIVALFTIFEVIIHTLIVPRFSILIRKISIIKNFCYILLLLIILALLIIGFTYLFSNQILWCLGNNYKSLNVALLLKVIGSCLGLISRSIYILSASKGWVVNPFISISISLLAMISGVFIFDLSSLHEILRYSIYLLFFDTLVNLAFFYLKSKRYVGC